MDIKSVTVDSEVTPAQARAAGITCMDHVLNSFPVVEGDSFPTTAQLSYGEELVAMLGLQTAAVRGYVPESEDGRVLLSSVSRWTTMDKRQRRRELARQAVELEEDVS